MSVKQQKIVCLDEICEKITDGTHQPPKFTSQGIPFLFVKNIAQGYIDFNVENYVSQATYEDLTKRCRPQRGDLLFSAVGSFGVAVVIDTDQALTFQRHIAILKLKKEVINPYFLAFFLNSPAGRHQSEIAATGGSQRTVTLKALGQFKIPLPPLEEQKRIAAIARKCDRLRRTRRFTQQLSDAYLQSVFLEMFGDLEVNPKQWEFKELDKISDIASGVTKGQKFNEKKTVNIPYLRVANVQDGYLDLSEIKLIETLPSVIEDLQLQPGDVLMTEGGDFDKLGRGAIWRGQLSTCIHQNHIFRVRVHKDVIFANFFAAFLQTKFAKNYFLKCSKKTTNLATINMTQLKKLPVPVPSITFQETFVKVVQRFERLRAQQREAERQAEQLFQTVLHRAFRGEL